MKIINLRLKKRSPRDAAGIPTIVPASPYPYGFCGRPGIGKTAFLANRLAHLQVNSSLKDWQKWAKQTSERLLQLEARNSCD